MKSQGFSFMPKQPPQGAALVTVMALVAILSILSVSLAWLGYQAIARVQAQRDAGQADQLAQAVIDYGRWVLWADSRGSAGGSSVMDHLAEPWAQTIPHSRLDQLLGAQMDAQDQRQFAAAAIAGQISDEQSRFDLSRAFPARGGVDQRGQAQLSRLFSLLGLSDSQQKSLLQQFRSIQASGLIQAQSGQDSQGGATATQGYEGSSWVELQKLLQASPFLSESQRFEVGRSLTWLERPGRINVNTVSPEVFRALWTGPSSLVDSLLARRDRIPFRTLSEISSMIPPAAGIDISQFDTQTEFFRMQGYAQFGLAETSFTVIVRRSGGKVSVMDRFQP
jgi:type II secretory pathway component PulK